jgi:hypothetical protein
MATPSLSFDEIDDLIYSARIGDLDALKTDITNLSKEHNCSTPTIINAAIDTEEESEGGTGACLLHWPAANGNLGMCLTSCPLSSVLDRWKSVENGERADEEKIKKY